MGIASSSQTDWRLYRKIQESTNAPSLRGLFRQNLLLLEKDIIQKAFFDRIDYLISSETCGFSKESLEDLKEDIELEIEFGDLKKEVSKKEDYAILHRRQWKVRRIYG